jgi:S1/P1 Nuclease
MWVIAQACVRRQAAVAGALLAFAAAPTAPAHAWGDDGHKIVCAIAEQLLDEAGRQTVRSLVRGYTAPDGGRYRSLALGCTFADRARAMARDYRNAARHGDRALADALRGWAHFVRFIDWHFLNVPRRSHGIAPGDCHDDCVLTAIALHRERLGRASLSTAERGEALLLLGHWVADVHQPLHVSYADDNGGDRIDDIEGDFYANRSLHAVWDTGIIAKALGSRDWWAYARALAAAIDPAARTRWAQSDADGWAAESYALTTEADVRYCRWQGETCRGLGPTRTLGASYQARFQPVVERRLQQAGVRLAAMISAALAGRP